MRLLISLAQVLAIICSMFKHPSRSSQAMSMRETLESASEASSWNSAGKATLFVPCLFCVPRLSLDMVSNVRQPLPDIDTHTPIL